uniref:non-specific serine/threonine protein kinase n=1 Tax=Meloidogyne hapla TaxID=6305 RepID=A0A1I8BQA8_MELHA
MGNRNSIRHQGLLCPSETDLTDFQIVKFIGIGTFGKDSDQIYMISDLLPGGDMAYHLKNQGRFSESRAKLLFCELALALDYLHRQR